MTDQTYGVIYSINADGTDYSVLHHFSTAQGYGNQFVDGLTLVGSTLYGSTNYGGLHGQGTLFSINTDGNGFAVLHNFSGGPNDGAQPFAGLVSDGSYLYGTTSAGGASGNGTVFAVPIPEPVSWHLAIVAFAAMCNLRSVRG